MARIVRFHETGGPEVLRIEDVDVPVPKAGEVRIAVKAFGLDRAEAMFRAGKYLERPQLPARLGYEAAGAVEAVGPGYKALLRVTPSAPSQPFRRTSMGSMARWHSRPPLPL